MHCHLCHSLILSEMLRRRRSGGGVVRDNDRLRTRGKLRLAQSMYRFAAFKSYGIKSTKSHTGHPNCPRCGLLENQQSAPIISASHLHDFKKRWSWLRSHRPDLAIER